MLKIFFNTLARIQCQNIQAKSTVRSQAFSSHKMVLWFVFFFNCSEYFSYTLGVRLEKTKRISRKKKTKHLQFNYYQINEFYQFELFLMLILKQFNLYLIHRASMRYCLLLF